MEKKGKNKYGNVYEIKLPNGKYTYICWIKQFSFGVFNYHSEKPVDNLDSLLSVGFKIYISGKETAIRKKIWQLIGHIDLEKENIEFPDLAIFMSDNKEHFIEQSRIMRDGNSYYAPTDYYISLLKKGYIAGFFDKPNIFELWLTKNLDNYPANEEIFPLPEKYSYKKILAIFPYYCETIIGRNGSFCFNPNLFSVVYIFTRNYFSSFCIYNNIF